MNAKSRPYPSPQTLARSAVAGLLILALESPVLAQGLLEGLARPMAGRSMRSSSAFRKGADGNYDPKAEPLGTTEPLSNRDAREVPPGQTQTVLDVKGPGAITHIWFHVPRPRTRAQRPEWGGQPPGDAPEDVLGRSGETRRRGPMGDFFANAFGFRSEVISLPVVVEDADSYNCYWRMPFRKIGPDRGPQSERQTPPRPLPQHRLDPARCAARRHAVFLRPIPAGVSRPEGQGLCAAPNPGQRPLRGHGPGRSDAQPRLVR